MSSSDRKALVFVPNKGSHDYTTAWDFGDLVFCTEGSVNRKDVKTMQEELSLSMSDAEPEDYILLTGLTSLCSIACAIFAKRFGCLNLLIFERGEYLVRRLTF